ASVTDTPRDSPLQMPSRFTPGPLTTAVVSVSVPAGTSLSIAGVVAARAVKTYEPAGRLSPRIDATSIVRVRSTASPGLSVLRTSAAGQPTSLGSAADDQASTRGPFTTRKARSSNGPVPPQSTPQVNVCVVTPMFVIVSVVSTARPVPLGRIELVADSPKFAVDPPSPVVIVAVQPAAATAIAATEVATQARNVVLSMRIVSAQPRGGTVTSPASETGGYRLAGGCRQLVPHEITRCPGRGDRSLVAAAVSPSLRPHAVQPDHRPHGAVHRHRGRTGRRAATRLCPLAHARPSARTESPALDSRRGAGESRRGDERHRHADDAAARSTRHRRRALDRVSQEGARHDHGRVSVRPSAV